MTAVLRVHQVARAAGLDGSHPQRIPHTVNEVWEYGDFIIKINPSPGARRLQDAARLLLYLPAGVHAPVPVAAGPASWGEWTVIVRLPGAVLAPLWPFLDQNQRHRAIAGVAEALRTLHHTPAPSEVSPGDPGRCPHPLPADRLLGLLADASDLPGLDRSVLSDAAERLADYAQWLDATNANLVHGDLHFENVLATADGTVTGLLDFEWSRPGPPDLDLDILLRSLAQPVLHHRSSTGAALRRQDFADVPGWLQEAYPALFAHPHLRERLWVYRLAYDVADLLSRPDRSAPSDSEPHHPYWRIVRHLQGRDDLDWFLTS
jgi:aminoglycoside phosphotransferase (APT) family kinase protein